MLRIILCVFIPLFFNHNNLSSQILKLSGGINRTWMNEKPFDTPCLTYTGSLGYDYLLDRDYHAWFYLSSEIGYIKSSGKNAITGSKLNLDHLHLNTLFKVKYSFENLMMSAGVGPSVDYRVIKGGQSNKLVFGARPEIGLSYFLSNRISLYFTVAYLKGFSGVGSMMQADSSDKTFYNNSLLFTIGIGYRVKKKKINYWHYSSL